MQRLFGTLPTGEEIKLYTLENSEARLTLSDFGAAVSGFEVSGRDIIGGFDTLESYLADDSHQGGIIGRVANRVGGAKFTMDGRVYSLPDIEPPEREKMEYLAEVSRSCGLKSQIGG